MISVDYGVNLKSYCKVRKIWIRRNREKFIKENFPDCELEKGKIMQCQSMEGKY
jgi:hypothetical protein